MFIDDITGAASWPVMVTVRASAAEALEAG
jgi:hypothetical protein